MEWMNETPEGLDLHVRVVPRAAKNEFQGLHDNALKIRLTTPPVDGKANQALIKFLSKTLKVPQRQITLVRGEIARQKTLRITGLTQEQLLERIPQ